ncbi:aromatic acid exporter family protein [Paenactinomyces guangxiensis]|uniref:Aromatic acid exporter family protein n=1 Tax=Paenactinomyces guangxiensis TaxID=1490290 RepID=A0A7W1WR77_9BACL|nr:aromatic acid exporter family protein [Paenactinomyces guangxiensis]MBA4494571.1 aromatic acid exporter family protein [Paenactinomyces guangxiensis]MBH8591666.1 aromatic acid exporter family protein [Paenactinomyces guangxiensis]
MRIGYRTIKTAVGTGLSIAVAQWLGLQFYASAGIITILCIKTTKKRSYQSAWERLLACIVAILLGAVFFQLLGYHPWTMAIILLFLIPLDVYLKVTEGIITSTVFLFHFYSVKQVNLSLILNELALMFIGIGFALLVNLYMPNVEKELKEYRQKIEQNFKKIISEIAIYLRAGESDWDGSEIIETAELLKQAKDLALRDIENHPHDRGTNYLDYFEMRERQFEILERIMPIASSLDVRCRQGQVIADFLDQVAQAIHPGNTANIYLEELEEMRKKFRESPLPANRQEFETRAALFYFVNEMKRYLILKRDLNKNVS